MVDFIPASAKLYSLREPTSLSGADTGQPKPQACSTPLGFLKLCTRLLSLARPVETAAMA